MLDRAYSLFDIKSIDEDQRIIEGIATKPTADRVGDVMDALGATFKLPLPFMWQHGKDSFVGQTPVGHVISARPTATGIPVRIQMERSTEPGRLKEILDFTWQAIKKRLVRGFSIGFSPIEQQPISGSFGTRFKRWEWVELSAVTVPMNADASIQLIKSIDAADRAALGTRSRVTSTPGASGSQSRNPMNVSEQIAAERADLQTKSARLLELTNPDGDLSDAEVAERELLTTDVAASAKKMERLKAIESAQAGLAQPVTYAPQPPSQTARTGRVEIVKTELPKGTIFTRYAMAKAAGKGSYSDTLAYAKRWDSQTPEVSMMIKADAGTAVVASPGWGGELVNPNTAATEFVQLLMPATIIGRVPGFRNVPFNIPIITQTGASTFAWVGEGASKPVGELAFTRTTMTWAKVAGIVVLTEELIRLSSPSAEETVRRDMVEQCAKFLDEAFIQVAKTATAANPASITNGVTSPAASGATLADLQYDLSVALATFDTAGVGTDGLVIVTTPALARGISMLTNPLGQNPTGFNVTPNGGKLLGYPVIVSASVDSGTIVIFKPSEIFLADEGRVTLDASNQATLDMDGGSPATATFSLWQNNCVGLRAERWINWAKRRATGIVAVIDTASYGPAAGSP